MTKTLLDSNQLNSEIYDEQDKIIYQNFLVKICINFQQTKYFKDICKTLNDMVKKNKLIRIKFLNNSMRLYFKSDKKNKSFTMIFKNVVFHTYDNYYSKCEDKIKLDYGGTQVLHYTKILNKAIFNFELHKQCDEMGTLLIINAEKLAIKYD